MNLHKAWPKIHRAQIQLEGERRSYDRHNGKAPSSMRYFRNRSMLHPVLGQSDHDWPGKRFIVELTNPAFESNGDTVRLDARFSIDVAAINDLIGDGSAECALWIYCGSTKYRKLHLAGRGRTDFTVYIPATMFRGIWECHPQVLTVAPTRLRLDEAHTIYRQSGRSTMELDRGRLLATHKIFCAEAINPDMDARAMFQLTPDETIERGRWHLRAPSLSDPLLTLSANRATIQEFNELRRSPAGKQMAMAAVYQTALAEALAAYLASYSPKEDSLTNDRSLWAGSLGDLLRRRNVVVLEGSFADLSADGQPARSAMWVAQLLLEDPAMDALRQTVPTAEDENS